MILKIFTIGGLRSFLIYLFRLVFLICLSISFVNPVLAEKGDYALFVQSYTSKLSCSKIWNEGIKNQLSNVKGKKIEIKTFYLNAKFLSYSEEKAKLSNLLDSIRNNPPIIIITEGDEALYSLINSRHPDINDYPIVFMGLQYVDHKILSNYPNICGYSSVPEYLQSIHIIVNLFPEARDFICLTEDNFVSSKARNLFMKEWNSFSAKNPSYHLSEYNISKMPTTLLVSKLQFNRNVTDKVVIVPKWTPYTSVLGKSSQCPFFSVASESVGNGAFAAYAPKPSKEAKEVGKLVSGILNGEINPRVREIEQSHSAMMFDYKQIDYFNISYEKATNYGEILHRSFYEEYKLVILITSAILSVVTVLLVIILLRSWRKGLRQKRDIILNEQINESLQEQRAIYDDMYHSMTECIIIYNTNYQVNFINKSLKNLLFETNDSTINGREYFGIDSDRLFYVYNGGRDILQELIAKVIEEKKLVEVSNKSFLRGVIHRVSVPITGVLFPILSNGVLKGVCFEFKDSTEDEINKNLLTMAVENSQIIPWRYSLSHSCFIFQEGYLESIGFAKDMNLLSLDKVISLVHPDNIEDALKQFDGLEKTGNCVMTFRAMDGFGEYLSYECRCQYIDIMLDNAMSFNIVGVLQNVQRFKNVENDLIKARDDAQKANEIKSHFLANMSHEIRTPLNSIIGFSSILKDLLSESNEDVKEMCSAIETNGNLLLDIVNDVMDLSMIESESKFYDIKKYSLNELLINYVDVNHQKLNDGVAFELEIPNIQFEVETDKEKLGHVLGNLISNAKKFTTKGIVTVGYRTNVSGDKAIIYVEDTGIGIAKENLSAIFERFYKVDRFKQGTGLGLSFCKSVLENLGGKISVSSQLGKGTRFEIYLPASFKK